MLRPRNIGLGARGQRRSPRVRISPGIYKVTASPWSPSSFSSSTLPLSSSNGSSSPSSSSSSSSSSQLQRSHTDAACIQQLRAYNTGPQSTKSPPPKSIAIIGGGLTGLTTAFYTSLHLPHAKITVYEKSERLGGWIDTERVAVKTPDGQKGVVHFERGARVVKGLSRRSFKNLDVLLFYDLVSKVMAPDVDIRTVGPDAPVGRYVYYPDHLVELGLRPLSSFHGDLLGYTKHVASQIASLFTEPVFKDLFPSLWNWYKTRVPPVDEVDMSVGDYLAGRFGSRSLVDNLMSAMIHGIYGGDVWKLSVNSSPLRWKKRHSEHIHESRLGKKLVTWSPAPDMELLEYFMLERNFNLAQWAGESLSGEEPGKKTDCAWVWFRDGFRTLTDSLAATLRANPNVTIKLNQGIESLRYQPDTDTVALTHEKGGATVQYNKVISTIFAGDLSPLVGPDLVPTLKEIKAVSIQAVNLWYPKPGLNHPYHGFGYLIPQSLPYDQNPEGALGVIFDSDREAMFRPEVAFSDEPCPNPRFFADTVRGSKFTVLLGGHLMDGMDLPTGDKAIEMAKSVLERHLGIPKEESAHAVGSTKTCRNCIPQHLVGHSQRMDKLDDELQDAFKGRLAAIGGSYHLPGVLPSIRAAWDMSKQVAWEFHADLDSLCGGCPPILPTGLGRAISPGPMRPVLQSDIDAIVSFAAMLKRIDRPSERRVPM